MSIFELLNSNKGATIRPTDGRFYLRPIHNGGGVLLSVGESPHSPLGGLSSRKGTTAFYLVPTLKILAMLSNPRPRGKTAPLAISAEKIIKDLVTSDTISNLRSDLKEMLHSYLLQEDDSYSRRKVHASYLTLDLMLNTIEINENPNQERRVA